MALRFALAMLLLFPTSALAETDELSPVPAQVMLGQPYAGDSAASKIRFISLQAIANLGEIQAMKSASMARTDYC